MKDLQDIDLKGKKVLLRLDLNVPIANGIIKDLTRIKRSLPTLEFLVNKGAKVLVLTHLGRPKGIDNTLTVKPVADAVANLMGSASVVFESALLNAKEKLTTNQVVIFENIRFDKREEEGSDEFAKQLTNAMDIYVNDAFSCSHRAHTSISYVAKLLPSYPGLLLKEELLNLESVIKTPQRPVTAIVGGSKVSTKMAILEHLLDKVDNLVIGGAMANTFLKALGTDVAASLYEEEFLLKTQDVMSMAKNKGVNIILPVDAVVAEDISDEAIAREISFNEIENKEKILDIGSKSVSLISEVLSNSKSVIWNGPVGAYEFKPFAGGSMAIAREIAKLTKLGSLISVAGGGDVNAAINLAKCDGGFTYISTAGGAFLEWLEGKTLPGIKALQ